HSCHIAKAAIPHLLGHPAVFCFNAHAAICATGLIWSWYSDHSHHIAKAAIPHLIGHPAMFCLNARAAITATGLIWSRYSTQITPVNYNLLAVNVFMAITGSYQLFRKVMSENKPQPLPTPSTSS
ncbi:hypothetical protein DUNSADRAFT_2700, partial [Dunaliella salina]